MCVLSSASLPPCQPSQSRGRAALWLLGGSSLLYPLSPPSRPLHLQKVNQRFQLPGAPIHQGLLEVQSPARRCPAAQALASPVGGEQQAAGVSSRSGHWRTTHPPRPHEPARHCQWRCGFWWRWGRWRESGEECTAGGWAAASPLPGHSRGEPGPPTGPCGHRHL